MRNETTVVNILFDAARGEVSVASREAAVGYPLGTLPRPVRAGYRFEGWTLDGSPVDESTVLESEEDVCLVAVWTRKKETQRNSMYKKQRTAVIVLAAAAVVLALVLILTQNFIVTIYGLTDTYYNEAGEVETEKYYVRKKGGNYALYDRKGNKMEINEQGYYIAHSGNQYSVDAETGAYELYAVVDYDAAGGEVLGFSDRIMLFPQITQTNTYSIEVKNEYGSYTFYRDSEGNVKIKGFDDEDSMVLYNQELFASLCVSCGYTLTMQKLDFSADNPAVPRLPDGGVDYAVYGLSDADSPAVYTITKAIYDSEGNCSADPDTVYSVKVGDAILSGGGYYIQMVGREAVYIVSADIQNTVLQPIEALVTPMVAYPSGVSTYAMVQNFLLGTVNFNGSFEEIDEEAMDLTVAFTYWDLESRMNSVYSSRPYICQIEDMMKGYEVDSDNATTVLGNLYEMEFIACRKLGITKEALKEYGLDGKVHYLSYQSPVTNEKNVITGYMQNNMIVSPKTENGTYYVASFLTDMIVEVDQYYFSFLQWEVSDWYEQYFFSHNIANVNNMSFQVGDKKFEFRLDNTASYMYYEKDGKMTAIDLEKGSLRANSDGSYTYTDQKGTEHSVVVLDLDNGKSYIVVSDSQGKELGRAPYEKYMLTSNQQNEVVLRLYESAESEEYTDYMISKNNLKYRLVYVDGSRQYDVIGTYASGESTNVKDYYRLTVWQEKYDSAEKKTYWMRNEAIAASVIFRTADGKEISPSLGSSNLNIYCEQYSESSDHKLDYTIVHTYTTDKGLEKTETVTATDNFRKLYTMLMWYSIEGDVDPEEFKKNTGMTMDEFIAQGEDACQAIFTYNVRDLSVNMNFVSGVESNKDVENKDDKTEETDTPAASARPEVKIWTDNNESQVVVRLYRYSDRKALITIEVIDLYDENGNRIEDPVSDPTKAQGRFYVQTGYANELLAAAERLLNQERVEQD